VNISALMSGSTERLKNSDIKFIYKYIKCFVQFSQMFSKKVRSSMKHALFNTAVQKDMCKSAGGEYRIQWWEE
jgi:hypothetical protein